MSETISRSAVLDRPYWTPGKIKEFLGEPDHVDRYPNGAVRSKEYLLARVVQAEKTPGFARKTPRKGSMSAYWQDIRDQMSPEKTAERVIALQAAIAADLKHMIIPDTGDLHSVFCFCQSQMKAYAAIVAGIPEEILSGRHFGRYPCPDGEICRRVALARPDLAFEAGVMYAIHTMKFGSLELLTQHFDALQQERNTGEPVHLWGISA